MLLFLYSPHPQTFPIIWVFRLGASIYLYLDWTYPTMGVPRRDCWCHWWSSSITLALNFIDFNFVVKTATQSSSLSGIQIGFPSPRDFFLLTSLMFLSQNFPIPSSYLFSPIYIILLVGLSWWEDIPHISGFLRVISLVITHVWRWLLLGGQIPPRHYFLFTTCLGVLTYILGQLHNLAK